MIGNIISFLILYLLVGFIAVIFSTPPKNCKKGDRRKLFFSHYFGLAILFYDYIYAVDQRYDQNLVQMR